MSRLFGTWKRNLISTELAWPCRNGKMRSRHRVDVIQQTMLEGRQTHVVDTRFDSLDDRFESNPPKSDKWVELKWINPKLVKWNPSSRLSSCSNRVVQQWLCQVRAGHKWDDARGCKNDVVPYSFSAPISVFLTFLDLNTEHNVDGLLLV